MAHSSTTWTREQARAFSPVGNAAKAARAHDRRPLAAGTRHRSDGAAGRICADTWPARLVAQLRAHINGLNLRLREARLAPELNGRLVLELAQAIERLAGVERIAAGRPTPGTLRPATSAASSSSAGASLVDVEPTPAQVPAQPAELDGAELPASDGLELAPRARSLTPPPEP